MRQRNMRCTGQMTDYQMDQQGSVRLHPDPCIILGGVTNMLQPNIHAIMPASGSTTNFDIHHLPDNYGNAIYYGMTPYNGVQHHQSVANLDLGVSAASNYYNSYMTTPSSGSGAFQSSQNHGSSEHFPSSSNHGVIGVPTDDYGRTVSTDEYGRNNYFMEDIRGSCKRKNAEGFPGNFQHFDASASSSSSSAPLNSSHPEFGVTLMDSESYSLHQYSGTGSPAIMEVGSHRSVRNRSGAIGLESVMPHNQSHLVHGNYIGAFHRAGSVWLDQQPGSSGGDGSTSAWNQTPAVTYLPNNNFNGGPMETGNMCLQGYHEISNNRGSPTYLHPSPFRHHHHHQNPNHPPPPPLMQGVRGQNISFYPQIAASSFRHPINNMPRSMMNPQDGVETTPRHLGPVPPTGLRIFRPHHGGAEATPRHHNLPYLRVIPGEEVAMLEIPDYHEVGNYIDHHRDMRLDIEEMSYEELLALGERIGNVNTGLTEETIRSHLKTRFYLLPATTINLEEEPCADHDFDVCIICQSDYENQEKIGTLDCGHEYHAECLKKWLLVKNVCPICKSSALTTKRKDV